MLASHYEGLSETAPSEASSKLRRTPITAELTSSASAAPSTSTFKAATSSAGESSTGDKPKKEPVTKRELIDAAADLMSDLQVETYSSMDKKEKTEL